MADVSIGCGEEAFRVVDALDRIEHRLRELGVLRRKPFDLLDIEDRIALHEGDGLFGFLAGGFIDLGAGDGVGVDHKLAALAFADMSAKLLGLPEGHPDRGAVACAYRSRPEHQDVDAVIGLAVVPKGLCDAPCRVFRVPGLHPGPHALFQIGDDLAGDAGVNVLPGCAVFGHGLVSFVCGFSELRETSKTGEQPDRHRRGTGNTGAEREWSGQPVAGPARPARNVQREENREKRRDQTMTKEQPGCLQPRLLPAGSANVDLERGLND